MLEICGVTPEQMPTLYESYEVVGTVKPEIARELGLPETACARLQKRADSFRRAGLMRAGPLFCLTPEGFLVSNAIIGALLDELEKM